MPKVAQVSYLLLVFACGLCWGKLEDYEFQEVDPPVMRVNKHLYKSESVVTHRFTVYPRDPPLALCRCWLSKKFPYCDGAHRAHNERNKDNLGPAIISGSKKLSLYMNDTSAEDKK